MIYHTKYFCLKDTKFNDSKNSLFVSGCLGGHHFRFIPVGAAMLNGPAFGKHF